MCEYSHEVRYIDIVQFCNVCVCTGLCPALWDSMDCSPPGSSVHADSLGKNTGVGCNALLQGIFPTNQFSCIANGFFNIWATREAQEYWGGLPIPSPGEFPKPGIKPGSPALQADSLPAELQVTAAEMYT